MQITTSPINNLISSSEIERINSVAGLNAFCSLYFWLKGWKTTDSFKRILIWVFAIIALLFAMQMTSRGAILAFSVGCFVGLRSIPRKRWLSYGIIIGILVLFLLIFPFFRTDIQNYQDRLYEDTGRGEAWANSIPLILANPWLGYGVRLLESGYGRILSITPHNPFILLALGSGIIPAIMLLLLWIFAFSDSIRFGNRYPFAVDAFPLISFAFVYSFLSNIAFMHYWVIASLAYCFITAQTLKSDTNGLHLNDNVRSEYNTTNRLPKLHKSKFDDNKR
jgi:O-antigen ligase